PRDAGWGAVSPARGEHADLCEGRPADLSPAVAVGAAPTPPQSPPVASGEGLPVRRREPLGVLWPRYGCQGDATGRAPVPRLQCADSSADDNHGRGQSVCSTVGAVLRSPSGRPYGSPSAGSPGSASSVEGARRTLWGLPPAYHALDGLAEPSSGVAHARGCGPCAEPGLTPSELPRP